MNLNWFIGVSVKVYKIRLILYENENSVIFNTFVTSVSNLNF